MHLSRSSYVLSKISILFILAAIQTSTFVFVGNYILEIKGMFFHHWFILFTTACFANLLGLNISSAFNSAVTIYILIPLLLIPQLILSGVVVKFDKLNPSIGNTATVPFVGDLMASRWAFEAAMVISLRIMCLKVNSIGMTRSWRMPTTKRLYFIPEVETKLQYCLNNFKSADPEIKKRVRQNLGLVKREISQELKESDQKLDGLAKLTPEQFDQSVFDELMKYLESIRSFMFTDSTPSIKKGRKRYSNIQTRLEASTVQLV